MQQPYELTDFSGGRTDNYVEGPINRFRVADNFVIEKYGDIGKLLSRFGSKLYNASFPLVNSAIERIGSLKNFRTTSGDKVIAFSNRKAFQLLGGGWTNIVGPVTSNSLFPTGTTTANVVSYASWNDHLFVTNDAYAAPSKFYNDGSNNLQMRTAGLPLLASSPTVTPTANTGKSFLYRFFYRFDYTVGTVLFEDLGAMTEVSVINADAPNVNKNAITNIPVLANGTTTNWDTASIKVEIYRTTNTGTEFFKVGEVTNGTTTFDDTVSDATLINNQPIYTEGGVVENDPTPLAKIVHIIGDTAYWANIKEGTEIRANRVRQAIPGDPDSCPGDFFEDVQDEIVGMSSAQDIPILMCKSSAYRIDGAFDELGRGGMSAVKISDTCSCVSSQSVVQTIDGVFWAGEDSYYFSNGYQVMKLCRDWFSSYKLSTATATQKKRIQGKYDPRTRRIWWTIQTDSAGSSDNNACDILHLDWGIKQDAAFTTASGGTQFAPTAIEFIDGDMLRGDRNGYLLIHQDGLVTDPLIDVAVTPANWQTKGIIWNYQSCAFNFGTSFLRKYATKVIVTAVNKSNLSLQIISNNDDGRKVENLKPIRFRGNITWSDPTVTWGDPSLIWEFDGLIEDLRRFPSNSLRFAYKQIEITNANVIVISSDTLGQATVDNALKTVTLDSASISDWPADCVGYTIAFSTDNYAKKYAITVRTADTLTFSDSGNSSNSGDVKWVIEGQPKGEVFNLLGYSIAFQLMGQTQQFFTPSESGSVQSS